MQKGKLQEFLDIPRDIFFWFEHKLQRAKNGWSYRDTWGYSSYLAKVIVGGLKHLKKTKRGLPVTKFPDGKLIVYDNNKDFKKAEDLWDSYMDAMIWTFEKAQDIAEDKFVYISSKKWTNKWHYRLKQRCLESKEEWLKKHPEDKERYDKEYRYYYPMPLEDCKRFEKGWKLFQEYFFSLFD